MGEIKKNTKKPTMYVCGQEEESSTTRSKGKRQNNDNLACLNVHSPLSYVRKWRYGGQQRLSGGWQEVKFGKSEVDLN